MQNGAPSQEPGPNETAESTDTTPDAAEKQFIPIKFNKEIKNVALDKAAELAQKGLKFEAIAADYEKLRQMAKQSGESVSDFLCGLEKSRADQRRSELLEQCGGNEEMADYILSLENAGQSDDNGLDELKREFPEIKDISDLPESVAENARLHGTKLLDEYLRYRHSMKRAAGRSAAHRQRTADLSLGSQADLTGGVNLEAAEFLKGLWK